MGNKVIKIRLYNAETIKKFINVVRKFASDVDIITERAVFDAKSLLGVYSLNLSESTYVRILTDNINEFQEFDMAMEEFK